jgi:hypothetical protein
VTELADASSPGYDFFISYARDDDPAFVAELYTRLHSRGHHVWWDRQRMPSRGRTFVQELRDAIAASARVVVVLGPAAMRSTYVREEWQYALSLSKPVTPLLRRGDREHVPAELKDFHTPDVSGEPVPDAAWTEIQRVLDEPVPSLGRLTDVPRIPPRYVPRGSAVAQACAQLLTGHDRIDVAPDIQVVAITGLGGSGKSVLAAALARLTSVRCVFDEVIWITCGPGFGKDAAIERVADLMAPETDRRSGRLESGACLLVLDDVWTLEVVEPFLAQIGTRSKILLTTREVWIADSLGSLHMTVGAFGADDALAFLASWVNVDTPMLPAEARALASFCEYLPLALAISGALARSGVSWADILDRLRAADLRFLQAKVSGYMYPSLLATLAVSVDALRNDDGEAARILEHLAAFQAETPVSIRAIETAVRVRFGISAVDTRRALVHLSQRSLLVVSDSKVTLHALVLAFLRGMHAVTAQEHGALVDAFATLCECDDRGQTVWSTVSDDDYVERHLVHHLHEAGRIEEVERVVTDPQWPRQKVLRSGITALIGDYERYLDGVDVPDPAAETFVRALRRVAHILRRYPDQYALQMYWRFGEVPGMADRFEIGPSSISPDSLRPTELGNEVTPGGLIAQSAERLGTVRCGVLTTIGGRSACVTGDVRGVVNAVDALSGDLIYRIEAHEDDVRALAVMPEKSLLATGSGEWLDMHSDCSIKLWDLGTGGALGTLSECRYEELLLPASHYQPIGDLWFSADGESLISASWDGSVGIWSLASLTRTATWDKHPHGLNTAVLTSDERFVVSGLADGSVGIWNYRTKRFRRFIHPEAGPPLKFRPLPSGAWVAGVTEDNRLLFVDAARGTATSYTAPAGGSFVEAAAHGPRCVLVVMRNGEVLHFDDETGVTIRLADLGQRVDAVHVGPDPTRLAVSTGNITSCYELLGSPGSFGRRIACAVPSSVSDIAWVVDTSGVVTVYAAGAPRRVLADTTVGHPVTSASMTADGLVIRCDDGFRWLRFTGPTERTIVIERFSPHPSSDSGELMSRNRLLTWNTDAWVLASLYRLPDGDAAWENALVARPRELQPFLEPHLLDAPEIRGSYYVVGSVDYESDRFALYRNGMEGLLIVDGATDDLAERLGSALPMYARFAQIATIVSGSSWYVEIGRRSLAVWDLADERLVAHHETEAEYEDAQVDSAEGILTVVTQDHVVRRLRLPDLNLLTESYLPPWDGRARIVSAGPGGLVAIQDAQQNLHIADLTGGAVALPLGLDAAAAGCAFASDGQSVLIVDERGNVSGFELPPW